MDLSHARKDNSVSYDTGPHSIAHYIEIIYHSVLRECEVFFRKKIKITN